jgi:hypothetical protein
MPVPALVAVGVVGAALALYAGVLDAALLAGGDASGTAAVAVERVADVVAPDGVARPTRLDRVGSVLPEGYRANVTLTAGNRTWSVGPVAPPSVDGASEPVAVRLAPGRVATGRLGVEVWQ